MLPKMKYNDSPVKRTQVRFGGYNHTKSCSEGEIYDMTNMSSDNYPLLSPRPLRRELETLTNPKGIGAKDALFYADDGKFYYDGREIEGLTLDPDTEKRFAVVNKYVVIFPDKKYYNTNAEKSIIDVKSNLVYSSGSMPANPQNGDSYFVNGGTYNELQVYMIQTYNNGWMANNDFKDNDICIGGSGGSGIENQKMLYYFSELAGGWLRQDFVHGSLEAVRYLGDNCVFNTSGIVAPSDKQLDLYFKVGDGLRIISDYVRNNTVAVVTAVSKNSISFDTTFSTAASKTVTLSRIVPDLDFICENDNRLWGCKGDMIYASKLGDPKNFEVFSGLSTDSYAVEAGSSEDFTGCVSYQNYPTFFKENYLYRMFGSKPSNYQLRCVSALGVEAGSSRSLAVAGGILFYHSPSGIVAYTGGFPQIIQHEFGEKFSNAVAGSTGTKYYVSMTSGIGYELFVYDTEKRVWMKEDDLEAMGFAFLENDLYCLCAADKKIKVLDKPKTKSGRIEEPTYTQVLTDEFGSIYLQTENGLLSRVEFGDFYENSPDKKGVTRYQIRLEVASGATVSLYAKYDSGVSELIKTIESGAKRTVVIPVIPRRCDHFRLSLTGKNSYTVYSITREEYGGSEI